MPFLSVLVAAAQMWTACSCARSPWTWPSMCSRMASGAPSGVALLSHHSSAAASAVWRHSLSWPSYCLFTNIHIDISLAHVGACTRLQACVRQEADASEHYHPQGVWT